MEFLKWYNLERLISTLVFLFIFLIQCSVNVSAISVMSVDFGSEWMKIAIVSPGVPMEIALNKESKRKTPVAVAFRDGERTFGEDALTVGIRSPANCYIYLLDLLGKDVDNPMVKLFHKRFPYYNIVPDPVRKTVRFQHDEETQYSVEELVGMLLHKAKEIAETSAGQLISDAVITVPGYFNQAERKALLQAAHLAGINVLQLINDYTAVALNYGIFRRKDFNETAQYIMFYDMGASSTTATIVSYQTVKTKEKGFVETSPQLSVLGIGYDRTLGGLEMQLRLQHHLASKFNDLKKTKNDVFKNPRSLAKLLKESGRVKNVLSANIDHFAQVEGLLDDIDMRLQVTREEIEGMCSDLLNRVRSPVDQALKSSSLTMDVISQVILVGAGTRMPAVQERLASLTNSELGKSLNTDEASVMGAAYKAADLSKGFKVKKFITKDAVLFPIQVKFERETENGIKQVKRTLFSLMNPYPQKKIITFNKHNSDFSFDVCYHDVEYLTSEEIESLGSLNLKHVKLTGVGEAVSKHQGDNLIESKGVKAHFSLDESGILLLDNVELVVEKSSQPEANEESTLSKLGSTISKLFSSSSPDPTNDTVPESPQEKTADTNGTESEQKDNVTEKIGTDGNDTKESSEKKAKEELKAKTVVIKEEIASTQENLIIPVMDETQLQASTKKLAELNAHDLAKTRREGALNSLESFVFEARNKLQSEEYKSAATPTEVNAILEMGDKLANWLDEDGWTSEVGPLESKLSELKKLTDPVWRRVKEHQERPEALSALEATLNGSVTFLATIKNMTDHRPDSVDPMFTQVEIDTLEKAINEVKEWKVKAVSEQSQLPLYESPRLTIKLILEKMAFLDREVKYLVNKAKIWRPKTKEPLAEPKKDGSTNKTESKTNDTTERVIPDVSENDTVTKPEENQTEKPTTKSTSSEENKTASKEDVHSEL